MVRKYSSVWPCFCRGYSSLNAPYISISSAITSTVCPLPCDCISFPLTQTQAPIFIFFINSSGNEVKFTTTCILCIVEPSFIGKKATSLLPRLLRTHPFTSTCFPYSVDFKRLLTGNFIILLLFKVFRVLIRSFKRDGKNNRFLPTLTFTEK